ncbi:MAG TPA: hypothetical protein VFK72_00165, partial [Nevskia sp.]|nr:hypothetical protein [Nevskia sp.]
MKLAVGALGKENAAHATFAEQPKQPIRADARIDERLVVIEQRRQQAGDDMIEAPRFGRRSGREERAHLGKQRFFPAALRSQPGVARIGRLVERLREQRLDPRPVERRAAHGPVAA